MAALTIMQAGAFQTKIGAGGGGRKCGECITVQMKFWCPSCSPILKCMAWCLWGGKSRWQCTKRCDWSSSSSNVSTTDLCVQLFGNRPSIVDVAYVDSIEWPLEHFNFNFNLGRALRKITTKAY
ncbi:hypothetical protein SAY86_020162 [Trapa natans]|uniref:Uncharacterized protein n=1 Tax=Trapa natans TaxID=22666 RepID=A0AAN7LZ00_TRANT|nr:hypothetical protein SAY86_020162 [Trapa natans]